MKATTPDPAMTGAEAADPTREHTSSHGDGGSLGIQPFAQVWTGGSDFELRTFDRPPLGPGESLVRLTAATVCGSDRHTVSGRRSGACPSVLGHEGVGIVEETRGDVPVGTRVVFSVTSVCGQCRNCLRGLSAKCTSVRKVGHESADSDWALSGTYASHVRLPAGVAVVPVPDSVPDGVAATAGCAVATVMAMCEAAGDLRGLRVFVNGIGMLGLTAVAAALSHGAAEVVAADPNSDRRRLAERAGATGTVEPGAQLSDVDVALELSGAETGVQSCIGSLGTGGTVVLAGSVSPGPEVAIDPEQMVRGWRTITGVHNFEPHHLAEAVDFLAADGAAMPWEDIFGGPINLANLPNEFTDPSAGLRTVVTTTP
ncbi:zinc-binding dehydrogenase [Brevibacterium sp. FAM 27836]|uniref:zinc-binding dehydrogenase n=1 Tax=Brevibacterium sp. FAM 27836 TaxID=3446693 RepID=UPI003F513C8E